MAFKKTRTAPSPYPRILFHGIRTGQALASLVVSSIMFYFIWNLVHEDFEAPRTFWTLLAASLVTFLFLIASQLVYVFVGLNPIVNLVGNGVLLALWAPAFAFLWIFTKATLAHVCNRKNWQGPVGIMVCRIYKALFAFAMLGAATTLVALLLDVYIWRKTISRGKYSAMNDDEKPAGISAPSKPYSTPAYSDSRNSIALEQYTTEFTPRGGRGGYSVIEDTSTSETTYNGGHDPNPYPGLPSVKRD